MKFLNRILGRPPEERPFLLLVTGYPAPAATVPGISRKDLSEFTSFHEAPDPGPDHDH
jgi:iodotyrosine deiodinase